MSQLPPVVLDVNNVSKKYCRNIERSLRYGVMDLWYEFTGSSAQHRSVLRPGEFFAVENVTFDVRRGECVALFGANGAGKSTLLKMLAGLFKPDTGEIRIKGRVGALIELGTGFNPVLSGRENVYVNGAVLGLSKRQVDERFDEIVDFSEVGHVIDAPVRTYSSGMRVRLGFAVAAHMNPEILLVDEVLAVGDVGFRMKCYQHLIDRRESGMSMVLVSHSVYQVSRVATRTIVMSDQRIIFDGDFVEGATFYESSLLENQPSETADQPMRGGARIAGITAMNKDTRSQKLNTGDTLRGEIEIQCDETIRDARLRVFLESPRTGVLGGFSTRHLDFRFDLTPPSTIVAVEIPDLPLLIGGYTMNAALYGPEIADFLDRRRPGAPFEIIGPPTNLFGYGRDGVVRFDHQWELVDRKTTGESAVSHNLDAQMPGANLNRFSDR